MSDFATIYFWYEKSWYDHFLRFRIFGRPASSFQTDLIINIQIVHDTEGHATVYGPVCHPKKVVVYGLLFGPYNIYGLTDRSINCHVAQSDINYLLYFDKDITLNKNETIKFALKLVVYKFVCMYGVLLVLCLVLTWCVYLKLQPTKTTSIRTQLDALYGPS
jgi:hypothetical protein